MIRVIFNKREFYTPWRIAWVSLLFLNINYIVFISFMNVCFETLATRQPVPLLVIAFLLFGVDLVLQIFITKKPFTIGNIIDLVVLFCLIFSFSLFGLFKHLVFLQVVALLKLQDTAYFNILVYNLVKKINSLRKAYVIVKISYWIVVVGHLLGCTFYAVDNYLIKTEYFGTISENPNLYYQGSQHVFTSIYSLSEIERYIYAIYYSFALLSTVAFGDIIGHNYFQDIMISMFLILATIGISLIIEQMYIVFRREKTMHYQLISRLKYVSEYIKTQPNISNDFRHDLVNYMVNSQWKERTTTPKLSDLTEKLTKSLFSESILAKTQNPLPLIIRSNFMPFLKSKYFPANYFLIDNNRLQNHLDGRIILNGRINVGYTRDLIGKQYIKNVECIGFGFDELVLRTNFLHKYLTVQLAEQAQVFVLNDDQFNLKMIEFKDYVNQYLPTPIEFYQISIDDIIAKNKQNHFCFSCKAHGHDLVDCPKFHYNPKILLTQNESYILQQDTNFTKKMYQKHFNHQRQFFRRRNTKSKKNTSRKSLDQMKRQIQGPQNIEIHFQFIKKIFNQNNLFQNLLEKTIVNYTEEKFINSSNDQIDSYYAWKIYYPEGKL